MSPEPAPKDEPLERRGPLRPFQPRPREDPAPATHNGHLLLVEDEAALRTATRELLTVAGFEVEACPDGRAALIALDREGFDAIVSDVRMPDMDGLTLLRAVRERDLDIPVILVTGGPSLETAIEALEHGALQYLIKPVPSEVLIEASRRAVKLGALARIKREALLATGVTGMGADRAGIEAAFASALDQLWMAGQPIVRADDRSLYAHEALLRTREPMFPNPGALLRAADRLGRLRELGAAVRQAVAKMLGEGVVPGHVFVNLHPLDLTDESLLDPNAPLSRFASRVVLEVTERASLDRVSDVIERVRVLRELGYRIALDDIGAGYAGLTSFAALSPDYVKLDRGLVREIHRYPIKQRLVESLAEVCRDLGITVVAEGIETRSECTCVVNAGCELLQGFLIGAPGRLAP